MQVNPYLFYNGNCEAALKYYQKVLGAQLEAVLTYEGGPDEMQIPPDYKKKVMHAKITIDGVTCAICCLLRRSAPDIPDIPANIWQKTTARWEARASLRYIATGTPRAVSV